MSQPAGTTGTQDAHTRANVPHRSILPPPARNTQEQIESLSSPDPLGDGSGTEIQRQYRFIHSFRVFAEAGVSRDNAAMPEQPAHPADADYLALSDEQLIRQCDVHIYRASGPGGQHRNKVSSAVRVRHRPTGVSGQGEDSRSQHENKRLALDRLRANIACQVRRPVNVEALTALAGSALEQDGRRQTAIPAVVRECLLVPHVSRSEMKLRPDARHRLLVSRKNDRYWPVAQFLLDLVEACGGRLAQAAALLDVTTSNLISVLSEDRHVLAAAQAIRKRFGLGPIK